ncbi:hypothetical protein M9Y10_035349 [Tritrichomonas musculus]|uniref:MULE transposase domain-containing protein n=1 Tax=Tritrichomonas musculus TaxID=1915356 RepID=A0ABR2KHH6_9EUKA
MIVEDENGKNQVRSFGIMEDRCKNSFRINFSNVKKLIGDIEVFVTDRNFTQIDAVCELWPNAIIIYCTRHIGKNIKDKVSKEMYEEFQKMLHNKKTEEELLKDFRDYIVAHQDTQASNVLQGLLDSTEHWLSSITSKYMHRGNSTSNRVEGFFGSFKNFTDHDILSLGELVKTIYIYAENLFVTSRYSRPKEPVKDHLLNHEDAKKIGTYALDRVNEEFKELTTKTISGEYRDNCCDM